MVKYHGPASRVEMYQRNMRQRGIGVYFVKESQYLRSFFAMTARYVPEGSKVLEFGYGPGTLGIYLSCIGYKVVGVDGDPEVIQLARDTNNRLDGSVDYRACDLSKIDSIFGPDSFDAVVSCVVMEHFTDKDIIELLSKQLVVAKINVFAVHSANIPLNLFHGDGGERLLKPSYWGKLIRKAGGKVLDRFGYGFSYTRMGQLNWRIAAMAENIFYRRLGRFAAGTGFVVKRA
jgi:SAM-dependent methyltransferase